ncbi:hypothetical protein [uncultured Nostoc sp.]|uniref:hypothetical protein n=1 Tax=uncultured Nostoc sp. TaxID=340711 RepID=UPI0035C982F3
MQALPQLLRLQSLESILILRCECLCRKKHYLDAIARVKARSKNVLVSSSSQVAECFTKHDMVVLVASEASLKTANIFEFLHTWLQNKNVIFFTNTLILLLVC